MATQREGRLVRAIARMIAQEYTRAWVVKLADAHTRGLPDLLVVHAGRVAGLEVKLPARKATPIQEATGRKLLRAGGAWAIVTSVEDAREVVDGLFSED